MPEQLDMYIWTKGINFKAYKLDQEITLEKLTTNLSKRKGDYEKRIDGWLTEKLYFPRFKTDDNLTCFIYMHFVKDGNASRVQGSDAWHYHPIGCAIDLKNKLIIVSTSSRSALHGLVEDDMFEPIRALTNVDQYSYNGDFLFWLAYIFNKIVGRRINDKISVEDVKAITSEQEKVNRSNAASAGTQVTAYTETKVILGLSGFATGIKSKFKSYSDIYELNLYMDGRISARNSANIEEIKEKTLYAIDIHNMIQESYSEFNNFIKEKDWSKTKRDFQITLVKEALETLTAALEGASSKK